MHKSAQSGNALFRGPMPRYAQLADILRRRIARNRWPAGTQLPTLQSLMQEFDVARWNFWRVTDSYRPSVDAARSSRRSLHASAV